MDRTERFYLIDQLLNDRRAVPLRLFMEKLGVSRATVKRDIEYMRDRLHAPIVWDRERYGYRFDTPDPNSPSYALPGLWFNASELHALMTMQHLLTNLQPDFLAPHVKPLQSRIQALLETGDHSAQEVERRIRMLHIAARPVEPEHFQVIASAMLKRLRLEIDHYNRSADVTLTRQVSPQRLVYYRDNWYLDAWCHLRKGLRSFGVDVITGARLTEQKAREVSRKQLDQLLGAGYGIFSGAKIQKAVLRFTPERARWVSRERWHSTQQGRFDRHGYFLLTVPYSNDTELLMDILKYGPDVEVLRPAALRRRITESLRQALTQY